MRPDAPQPLRLVSISLLGGLFVQHANQPAVALSPQQTTSLLAYLALNVDRITPRLELAALLWPDTEQENAFQNLRQCLRTLRRVLEPHPLTPGSVLLATRTDVRLNPETVHTDVSGFSAALDAANAATTAEERIRYLQQAFELYRGELLPGYYLDYFVSEQRRLAERYLQALHDLTRELEAAGDSEQALKYAQRAAILDPTSDTACISLMRVYASLGQGSAVTREFQ